MELNEPTIYLRTHASKPALGEAITFTGHILKPTRLSFPGSRMLLPTPPTSSSVGPDTGKQRFPSSRAVKIPCASPLRHKTEGRIISEIIS